MKFLIKYYCLQTLLLTIMAAEIATTAYNENAIKYCTFYLIGTK